MSKTSPLLNSLILVEERLAEAKYFSRRLAYQRDQLEFSHNLNAFLSASRSVTFMLQKVMARVPEFSEWWAEQQAILTADKSARFFLNLRNFSQKAGRISVVGVRVSFGGGRRWSYRFAGNQERVPSALLHRDVVDCCNEHIAKLALTVLHCADRFPYHTCVTRALTEEGLIALGLSMSDLEGALGLGEGWMAAGAELPQKELLRILRAQVDGVDFKMLMRLSKFRPRKQVADGQDAGLGINLLKHMVSQLESESRAVSIPEMLGTILLTDSEHKA